MVFQEADRDLPRNVYVLLASSAAVVVLQTTAAVVALGAALSAPPTPRRARRDNDVLAYSNTTTYTPLRSVLVTLSLVATSIAKVSSQMSTMLLYRM